MYGYFHEKCEIMFIGKQIVPLRMCYATVALEVASKHCTLVGFAHYTSAGFVVIH